MNTNGSRIVLSAALLVPLPPGGDRRGRGDRGGRSSISCDDFASARFYQFVGPDSVNPAIGTDQEWKKLDVTQSSAGGRWVSFNPVSTRGIKLLILKTSDPQVSWIDGLHVFTDLADRPVPELKPAAVRRAQCAISSKNLSHANPCAPTSYASRRKSFRV